MFIYIMLAYIIVRLVNLLVRNLKIPALKLNLFNRGIRNIDVLIRNNFIDTQVLFATKFKALANVSVMKEINSTKAYAFVKKKFENEITAVYQYNTFDYSESKALFNVTIFVLSDERIIELGYDYAVVLYTGRNYSWTTNLLAELATCRAAARTTVIGFANADAMN
jgi:hypothetical protein